MAFRNTDLLLDNEKHPHQTINFYAPNEIYCKLLKTKGEKTIGLEALSMQDLRLS